jgi:hypothetical protein
MSNKEELSDIPRSFLDFYIRNQTSINSTSGVTLTVVAILLSEYIDNLFLLAPVFFSGLAAKLSATSHLNLPEYIEEKKENSNLVLFVHGWCGDSQDTWKEFPSLMKNDDKFKGWDILSIDYPTYIARRNLDIHQLVSWILDELRHKHDIGKYKTVAVIAHSMGGLITREIYLQSTLSDVTAKIKVIVEVGTPHKGAKLADLASALGVKRAFIRDLEPGSSFLLGLETHWDCLAKPPITHGIGSPHDKIVSKDSASANCTKVHWYPMWGHKELVKPEDMDDDRYVIPTSIITNETCS